MEEELELSYLDGDDVVDDVVGVDFNIVTLLHQKDIRRRCFRSTTFL